jgi:hypothetical protein
VTFSPSAIAVVVLLVGIAGMYARTGKKAEAKQTIEMGRVKVRGIISLGRTKGMNWRP